MWRQVSFKVIIKKLNFVDGRIRSPIATHHSDGYFYSQIIISINKEIKKRESLCCCLPHRRGKSISRRKYSTPKQWLARGKHRYNCQIPSRSLPFGIGSPSPRGGERSFDAFVLTHLIHYFLIADVTLYFVGVWCPILSFFISGWWL